jgi:hypothetical protein
MPLRKTWESDGNQGWKDGVPGSQAPRESRKEEGNTGNKKALPGTRMGSAGRTGRRNKRFGDKKWGSRSRMLDGNPQRLKRRRATLPHPLECSTIAAPGLSYRVRNGTGRLTRAMTTANLTATARKPKESKPACHRWRFGNRLADARQSLPLYRSVTIPTHIAVQDDPAQERRGTNPTRGSELLCRRRPLVPVGSTPHRASTSGLSNTCSTCGLQDLEDPWNPNLGAGFPLRCFQRLSLPNVANRPCRWRDNRHTRGSSTQVLSYYGQASSGFQRAQRIETKLSHDVLNPARVPL